MPVFKPGDPPPPVSISALSDRGLLRDARHLVDLPAVNVSISALSDRGLLRDPN